MYVLSHCGEYVGGRDIQPRSNNASGIYIPTTIRDVEMLINGDKITEMAARARVGIR